MRPDLTKDITIKDFSNYYWLKEELQTFCREHGMSASSSKLELTDRINVYLLTGEIKKPIRKTRPPKTKETELSLETVITENHRCSQEVRAFFKSVIPNFHFSTYIQNYLKTNIGRTYRDVVLAWNEEEERKKDPTYKRTIAPQFEYNQFIQDFFADPKNQQKSREEAIDAWNQMKRLPGSNKYNPKLTIE
ncbi:DUF6434 domain-containing protein [Bacillus alkalicellulosilyticus]|uniref:DUF6434 domain-containing protein n=1 Tax=Alkalihalobacterium alkalicellulosilyticum TaxID=1912214 RepID=UPI0009961B5F|nr:DUF6434 domain-containing protein [Bacillus alkalicellulosilyticus]